MVRSWGRCPAFPWKGVKIILVGKAKKVIVGILVVIGILAIIAGGLMFYWMTKVDYKFTGQQLFDEVNKYRTSIGAPALELDPILCDNLVERWLSIKEPNSGHSGYEEWLKTEGISDNPKYGRIGEIYMKDVSTPTNAINWWLNSPGHKSTLEMKEMVYGCAYASGGTGVVILAEKRSKN